MPDDVVRKPSDIMEETEKKTKPGVFLWEKRRRFRPFQLWLQAGLGRSSMTKSRRITEYSGPQRARARVLRRTSGTNPVRLSAMGDRDRDITP